MTLHMPRICTCLIFTTALFILAVYRIDYLNNQNVANNGDYNNQNSQYDFIVIGSATGGVIASRLSEQKKRVLLIEAGPDDETYSCKRCSAYPYGDLYNGTITIPYANWWFKNVQELNWNELSAPSFWNYNKSILHRKESVLRARMLGGCLSHNGHAWFRGDIRDYDFVSQQNNLPDWSFTNILPYFRKIETYFGENGSFRGSDGPVEIKQTPPQPFEYKLQALFDTAIAYGVPYNNYMNGIGSQYGIGIGEANIAKYKNGKHGLFNTTYYRQSSSESYIRNIGMKSGFLTVWSNTTVQRILFDKNDIPNAIGVQYWDSNGILKSVYCNKEVIVSAGLHQSPQLLILSGIGPAKQLNKFNIEPIGHHVESHEYIGKNGQDHVILNNIRYRVKIKKLKKLFNYNTHLKRPKGILINKYFGVSDNKYVSFYHRGRIEINLSSFKYNRLGFDYNDIHVSCFDGVRIGSKSVKCFIDTAIYSKNLTIELNSNDSRIYPIVYNNYFSDSRDYDIMISAIHKLREIFEFNKNIFFKEIYPGINKTDEELRDIIFNHSYSSIHGVGTISMGDNNDVYSYKYPLTSKCLLRGVNKLRVCDASIWPYSPNGGTQVLVFIIGEKCVQYIIDDDDDDDLVLTANNTNFNAQYIGIIFIFGIVTIVGYQLFNTKHATVLFLFSLLILNWFLIIMTFQ